MEIKYAAKVDKGVKEINDDRALVGGTIYNMNAGSGFFELPGMAIVCDGCGGYAGGYLAAQTVLEIFQTEDAKNLLDTDYLATILKKSAAAVFAKKEENPEFSEMCTTIVGCIFGDEKTTIFHAGDSRVYRFDGTYLAKMTSDHSVVQDMIDIGRITPEEAMVNPSRHMINRCIGVKCPPPEIYVSNVPILEGEKYLFCSDGFWEKVSNEKIIELLSSDMTLDEMVEECVTLALKNGSEDNITVCICSREGEHKVNKVEVELD